MESEDDDDDDEDYGRGIAARERPKRAAASVAAQQLKVWILTVFYHLCTSCPASNALADIVFILVHAGHDLKLQAYLEMHFCWDADDMIW